MRKVKGLTASKTMASASTRHMATSSMTAFSGFTRPKSFPAWASAWPAWRESSAGMKAGYGRNQQKGRVRLSSLLWACPCRWASQV